MKRKYNIEELKTMYETQPLTKTEIANIFNISVDCLNNNIKKYNWIRPNDIIEQINKNRSNKISNTLKNKSIEEKQITLQKQKQTNLERYGNCNYRNVDKWKQTYNNKSVEEKQIKVDKWKQSFNNKSEKEKQKLITQLNSSWSTEKRSLTTKQNWSSYTDQKRKDIGLKISQTYKNKSDKEKQKIIEKRQNTINNFSNSKKQEIHNKLSNIYNNRTEKEKQRIKNKIKQKWNSKSKEELDRINKLRIKTRKLKYSNKELLDKSKQTSQQKYNCNHYSQRNIPKQTLELIHNKKQMRQFLQNNKDINTRHKLAKKLHLSQSFVNRKLKIYTLDTYMKNIKSKYEQEIFEYLSSIYEGKILQNVRTIIPPYELDFYIPDKNIAIEFNGNYFHNNTKHNKNYHNIKSKLCEDKGIRLIHIFEYEWNDSHKQTILKDIIKTSLGIYDKQIYARKCNIKVLPTKDLKTFLNENHIQGFRGGKFAICLEHNNKIIMCYIFGHPFLGKGKYEIEVIRACTKLGYQVIGGVSKIWKYFINNFNYNNCVFYVNYNYFNGNSLTNIKNMNYLHTTLGYTLYDTTTKQIIGRNPMNNNFIKQNIEQGKLFKIYNAGTKVYIWTRKEFI